MRKITTMTAILAVVAGWLATGPVLAQEEAASTYIYGTYFSCDVTRQERADELFAKHSVPVYDKAVADGTISGYGWLAHHTGGKWRRIQYFMDDSVQGLLDAQEKIGEAMDAAGDDSNEFGSICNAHDDYIWQSVAGNVGTVKRGKAGMSVYHVCDMAREDEADAIVKQVMAPIYDKAVADGKIRSWGWSEHIIGGKYRRLETFTAADFDALVTARASIIAALEDAPLADTFSEICGSHSDYLWEIQAEKP